MVVLFGLLVLGTLILLVMLRALSLRRKRAVSRRLSMLGEVDGFEVASGWTGASMRLGEVFRSFGGEQAPKPFAMAIVGLASLLGIAYAGWLADRSGSLWGLVGGTALAALAWMFGGNLLEGASRYRRDRLAATLPDWVDTIACYLHVGMPFESAVGMTLRSRHIAGKELKEEWFRYLQDTRLGISRNEALVSLARRCDSEEMHRLIGSVMASPDDRENLAANLHAVALDFQALALRRKRARDSWRMLALFGTGIGMAIAIGSL